MRESMWAASVHNLEAQLVCSCGAMNSPNYATNPIKLDEKGNAVCDQCGDFGPLQKFLPVPRSDRRV